MRGKLLLPTLAILLLLGTPAQAKKHSFWVQAEVDPQHEDALTAGATIAVLVDSDAPSAALYHDVARRIVEDCARRGLVLAPPDEADFLLLFGFGTDKEQMQSQSFVTSDKGEVRSTQTPRWGLDGISYQSQVTLDTSPSIESDLVDTTTTVYQHRFVATVIDGKAFRESQQARVVWRGEAVLAKRQKENPGGESPDRALMFLDLLRIAATEHLGQNQERTKKSYSRKDVPDSEAN
jgi:hypothetical protein